MNPMVEKYIADKEERRRQRYEESKAELANRLLFEGYYEKEYVDPASPGVNAQREQSSEGERWFKKVPLKLTDEEYERLSEYVPSAYRPDTPGLVVALQVAAWAALVMAAFVGLVLGDSLGFGKDFVIITVPVGGILTVLLLGAAEIVKKLHSLEKKLKKDE